MGLWRLKGSKRSRTVNVPLPASPPGDGVRVNLETNSDFRMIHISHIPNFSFLGQVEAELENGLLRGQRCPPWSGRQGIDSKIHLE